MDLKTFETFCLLAENKSFSKTAEKLFLTQPAISKQIMQLEEELHVTLFNRTTKKISLTPAGEIFYQYSLRILREVKTLKMIMQNFRGLKVGEVSIGASTLPGEYILPSLIYKFKREYPEINFNLIIKDSLDIVNSVASGILEMGIVGSKYHNKEIIYENFIKDKIVFAGKYENKKKELDISQLKNLPIINREEGSGTIHTVKNFLYEKNFDYKELNFIGTFGSLTAVKNVMKQGLGYAFISETAIKTELKRKELSIIQIKNITPIKRVFYIVYSKNFNLSPAAVKLKNILLKFGNL